MQPAAQAPNEHWSMDFMTDSLYDGRRFRVLTIVDNMTRESPAIAVDYSLPSTRVVAVLERLTFTQALPKVMYVDNGPEFVAKALDDWAHRHGVKLAFSRPGKPTDNPFVEALNGRLRAECLDQHWFATLADAQATIEAWRVDYNTVRPHTALQHLAPVVYKATWLQTQQTGVGKQFRWISFGCWRMALTGYHSNWYRKRIKLITKHIKEDYDGNYARNSWERIY